MAGEMVSKCRGSDDLKRKEARLRIQLLWDEDENEDGDEDENGAGKEDDDGMKGIVWGMIELFLWSKHERVWAFPHCISPSAGVPATIRFDPM